MDYATYFESMNHLWDYLFSIETISDNGFEHYNHLGNQADVCEKFYVYRFSNILSGISDLLAINLNFCNLMYSNNYASTSLSIQSPLIESLQMASDMIWDIENFISDIYLEYSKFENKYNPESIKLFFEQKELLDKIVNELELLEECVEEYK